VQAATRFPGDDAEAVHQRRPTSDGLAAARAGFARTHASPVASSGLLSAAMDTPPAAVALMVSADVVVQSTFVVLAYSGSLKAALLPGTGDIRVDIAGALGDLILLAVLRGAWAMAPLLLGAGASRVLLSRSCASLGALGAALVTAYLAVKAALSVLLSDDWQLYLDTLKGEVVLYTPLLLLADAAAIAATWWFWAYSYVHRRQLQGPASGEALDETRRGGRLNLPVWLPGGGGGELAAPLLGGAAAEESDWQPAQGADVVGANAGGALTHVGTTPAAHVAAPHSPSFRSIASEEAASDASFQSLTVQSNSDGGSFHSVSAR
jgi:hypothetical protein